MCRHHLSLRFNNACLTASDKDSGQRLQNDLDSRWANLGLRFDYSNSGSNRCVKIRSSLSGAILIGISRPQLTIRIAFIFEPALRAGLAFLVLLTVAAQPGERHCFQTFLGDFQSA